MPADITDAAPDTVRARFFGAPSTTRIANQLDGSSYWFDEEFILNDDDRRVKFMAEHGDAWDAIEVWFYDADGNEYKQTVPAGAGIDVTQFDSFMVVGTISHDD